ncbi:MAG TPA: GspH/FimT family pseudopilin [Azospirillum sp.]|nr:GspH/FimT family pseudopilin [Azospirillum sp.]
MARTPTSAFDRGGSDAGFTLLELLVALTLAGVLLALVPPALGRGSDAARLRGAATVMARTLALARSEAILTGRESAFVIDLDGRRFGLAGRAAEATFAPSVRVELTVAARAVRGRTAAIPFHPDGSAGGGEIRLSNAAGSAVLRVDWLTGRVETTGLR